MYFQKATTKGRRVHRNDTLFRYLNLIFRYYLKPSGSKNPYWMSLYPRQYFDSYKNIRHRIDVLDDFIAWLEVYRPKEIITEDELQDTYMEVLRTDCFKKIGEQ